MKPDRFNVCDKWHPGEASRIIEKRVTRADGKPYTRRECGVCHRVRFRTRYQGRKKILPIPKLKEDYGVVQLNWKAPEFKTNENT